MTRQSPAALTQDCTQQSPLMGKYCDSIHSPVVEAPGHRVLSERKEWELLIQHRPHSKLATLTEWGTGSRLAVLYSVYIVLNLLILFLIDSIILNNSAMGFTPNLSPLSLGRLTRQILHQSSLIHPALKVLVPYSKHYGFKEGMNFKRAGSLHEGIFW